MQEFAENAEENDEEELFEHYSFTAGKDQKQLRIDKFLSNFIENSSRTKIQNTAHAGNIRVNGQPVKPNYKVKPGDEIKVVMSHPPHENLIVPQDIPLDIVFEDDQVVVVNKPAGMVVHPCLLYTSDAADE